MRCLSTLSLASAACALLLADAASAQVRQAERLRGGNENPPVITDGTGNFRAERIGDQIEFRVRYDLSSTASEDENDVTQAHLHIGNPGTNGGIVVFLCSNLDNEPDGVTSRECPPSPGVVEDVIVADDVIELVVDNATVIEAGDLDGLFRLMTQGAVYANAHSNDHPAGEVRGQVRPRIR